MTRRPFKLMIEPVAMFGGVCSGLAYSFGFPTWLVRSLFVLFFLMLIDSFISISIILIYTLLMVIGDRWVKNPDDYDKITE